MLIYCSSVAKEHYCWNHARICSRNWPVLSNEGQVSCSMKQGEPLK